MNTSEQKTAAERFLEFHRKPGPLLLPNAWDAVSAKIYELEGFRAVGTTSAGIANAAGYPDGQQVPLEKQLDAIGRIAAAVAVPVSADIEAGYGDRPDDVARTVTGTIDAGAVGVNLEDGRSGCGGSRGGGLYDPSEQIERIAAAREAADRSGIPIVINARTDAFLVPGRDPERLRSAVERGNAYRRAGADCVFVPDMGDLDDAAIGVLAREIEAPLNVIAGPSTPPVARLRELGVARLSFGPRPMRAVLSSLREMAREWIGQGSYEKMARSTLGYDEINRWFAR